MDPLVKLTASDCSDSISVMNNKEVIKVKCLLGRLVFSGGQSVLCCQNATERKRPLERWKVCGNSQRYWIGPQSQLRFVPRPPITNNSFSKYFYIPHSTLIEICIHAIWAEENTYTKHHMSIWRNVIKLNQVSNCFRVKQKFERRNVKGVQFKWRRKTRVFDFIGILIFAGWSGLTSVNVQHQHDHEVW